MPSQPGPPRGLLSRAWLKWKALNLPWRSRFLAGYDLQGNTYWHFRPRGVDPGYPWRRIVEYPNNVHHGAVKVSPLWHQWLRYTRDDPPTMQEQQLNATREQRIKILAAEADARWEAKPKLTDAPGTTAAGQPAPALESASAAPDGGETAARETAEPPKKADPWAKARPQGPGEKWQPAAWTPSSSKK